MSTSGRQGIQQLASLRLLLRPDEGVLCLATIHVSEVCIASDDRPQPLDGLLNDRLRRVQIGIANTQDNYVFAAIAGGAGFVVCQPGVSAFPTDSLYERRELHIFVDT